MKQRGRQMRTGININIIIFLYNTETTDMPSMDLPSTVEAEGWGVPFIGSVHRGQGV